MAFEPSATDFGGMGLIQNHTARFARDGHFEAGYSFINPYERYLITAQALPWLEATFRYTSVRDRDFQGNANVGLGSAFKDRGADLKFRLKKETRWMPALAVGLQDMLGTGLFEGEYLVASKRYYDFDFTFGIGWAYSGGAADGRGSIKNPLVRISKKFASRDSATAQGGSVAFSKWFGGETAGLFGGVEWQTPVTALSLKLEYDPNRYRSNPLNSIIIAVTPWNFGFNYRLFDWMDFSVAFERGRNYMGRLTLRTNFNDPGLPKFDAAPPQLRPRPSPVVTGGERQVAASVNRPNALRYEAPVNQMRRATDSFRSWETVTISELEKSGLEEPQLELVGSTARVVYADAWPKQESDFEKRLQLAALAAPPSVGRISFASRRTPNFIEHESDISKLNNVILADTIYDAIDRLGFEFYEIEISGFRLSLRYSEYQSPALLERVAHAFFRHSSAEIKVVALLGDQNEIKTYSRESFSSAVAVERIFEKLEEYEIQVSSVDLNDRVITFHVQDDGGRWFSNVENASSMVERNLPFSVTNVVFQGPPRSAVSQAPPLRKVVPAVGHGADGTSRNTSPITLDPEARTRLFAELADEGFVVDGIHLTKTRATLFAASNRFRQVARVVGRAARVVHNNVPASIEEITIVTVAAGMELNRVTIRRVELEKAVLANGSAEEIFATATIEGPKKLFLPRGIIRKPFRYPRAVWSIAPVLRSHIGSGENFYLYQLQVGLGGAVEIWKGWEVVGVVGRNVYNNFDRITTDSPSELPKVRSDIKEYLQQGTNNVIRFQTNYLFSPAPGLYARLSAGIFEEMYGGYGGELLYRPFGSRIAVGVDLNWAQQRDFDQKFVYRNYNVKTGHVNLYWQVPYKNILAQAHIGQYLAGDRGVTLRFSREFDSGISAGVWSTFTDVSFEKFGEGSFDKGFFLNIPFEVFLTESSTRGGRFAFRPLSKDGGQMLTITPRLYDVTEGGTLDRLTRDWDTLLN